MVSRRRFWPRARACRSVARAHAADYSPDEDLISKGLSHLQLDVGQTLVVDGGLIL
jgi:hypothetical protein